MLNKEEKNMPNIVEIMKTLPAYAVSIIEQYTIPAIIAAALFIFILFFSNKVASFLRKFFICAILVIAAYAYFNNNWTLTVTMLCLLLLLIIIRLIVRTIQTVRTNRRNKRIEERALERAAKRRGSFKNKRGYSGARKPIEDETKYTPEDMDKEEIEALINNEFIDDVKSEDTSSEASTDDLATIDE